MTFRGPIVIVNYNSGAYLARCLRSIEAHTPDAHTIVVDNASTDCSERVATATVLRTTVLRNEQNLGFAAAVNQGVGVADAGAPAVLLLNPDCQLFDGAAELMAAELDAHPECAVVGPRVLDEDGSIQGNVRGDPTMLTGLLGRSSLLRRLFPSLPAARRNVRVDLAGGPALSSATVDWVSGACMMIRRAAFDAVGGLDERYFLYWEDADLCRRLRASGFVTRYVPTARVKHDGAVCSRSAPALAVRAFHRSAYRYYVTHVCSNALSREVGRFVLGMRCAWQLMSRRAPGEPRRSRRLSVAARDLGSSPGRAPASRSAD